MIFGHDFLTYMIENFSQSFKEDMSYTEAPYWKEAINSEINSILQNHCKLCLLPQVTNHWDASGSLNER